jgi:glycosyltransferase involved in cell wall biosynthesis
LSPSARVAVVTSRLDVGGTERHLTRILPALRRRGIDIVLYAMDRGGALESELAAGGVRIEGPAHGFPHWPRATLALARFLRRERPAIVHFFLPRPYVYGSIAAELAGQHRRIMSRRSLTDYQENYPLLGGLERILHRRTAGLIGNSQAVVDQLAAEVDDPSKLALIHNGIALPEPLTAVGRQRARGSLRIPDGALVMAVVANLIAYKGHRELIAALARVKDELPSPWRLLVIGRDDGIGAELKDKAEAASLSGNILWLGERSDVGELLGASDIFVLPSHQEGFSNALLEAMAANEPVIATAVGGNLDAVVDGETGLLVRPRDSDGLAGAILQLARDPSLRQRFADAARSRVERLFSLDVCVGRYERLYRALSGPGARSIREILEEDDDIARGNTAAAIEHAS